MSLDATTWLIIPCAGIGSRFNSNKPKQYHSIEEVMIIDLTYQRLQKIFTPTLTVFALHQNDQWFKETQASTSDNTQITVGGSTRQASVHKSLQEISQRAQDTDWVVIHDAVRPHIKNNHFTAQIQKLHQHPVGGYFALQATDAVIQYQHSKQIPLRRDNIYLSQTPQIYRYKHIYQVISNAEQTGQNYDDEASAMAMANLDTLILQGTKENTKITFPEDL